MEIDAAAQQFAEAFKILGKVPLLEGVRDRAKRHPANLQKMTVKDLYEGLLPAKRQDGATEICLKDLRLRLRKFSISFYCNIGDITAGQINEFLRSLAVKGRSRNNYRRAIGTLLRYAEIQNAIPHDHIRIRDIDRAIETPRRRQTFTPQEIVQLLKAAQLNANDLGSGINRRYANAQGLLPLLLLGGSPE